MKKTTLPCIVSVLGILFFSTQIFADDNTDGFRIEGFPAGMGIAFAVESPNGLFVIDAGSPGHGKSILKHLKKFSQKPLRLIILTHGHFDHYGSAEELHELTGTPIAIHISDAKDMEEGKTRLPFAHGWGRLGRLLLPMAEFVTNPEPTHPQILLHDGDSLTTYGLPAVVVSTPGHTQGSISVLLSDGTAFTGDLLVTSPRLQCQCYYADSWSDLNGSLSRMQNLKPTQVFSGHSLYTISGDKFLQVKPARDWSGSAKKPL
jgi:glyoxylase-like metal-dependent hydrolase (beta-lactamase superfamily II)